jgi:molybdopterin biosynthesis enzyme
MGSSNPGHDWTFPDALRQVRSMTERPHPQPIPLSEALTIIDRVDPVAPRDVELSDALGFTLATDAGTAGMLRLSGARLRRIDLALLASQGVARLSVRAPRLLVLHSAADASVAALIGGAVAAEGGLAHTAEAGLETPQPKHDAVIGIGIGPVLAAPEFAGVSLKPGGAIAFGYADSRPTLILPAGIEAFAGWLAVGRRLLSRLAFRLIEEQPFLLELARPIASTRGVAEVMPVRRRAAQIEPIAGDAWSPQSLARADGWILVAAESDGLAAGIRVQMRPWP